MMDRLKQLEEENAWLVAELERQRALNVTIANLYQLMMLRLDKIMGEQP